MDKKMKSPIQFKLSLLKNKRRDKTGNHNKNFEKDLPNSKSNIGNEVISSPFNESYRKQLDSDSYPPVKLAMKKSKDFEENHAIDNDVSKHIKTKKKSRRKDIQELNNSENSINFNENDSTKETNKNNSESSICEEVLINSSNLLKIDQIDSTGKKSSKRRRTIELQNLKSNYSKKSRTDKEIEYLEEDPQHDKIIPKQQTERSPKQKIEYNTLNFERSKFNDNDYTKNSLSTVEQLKNKKKKKGDKNKDKIKKGFEKELNNSESDTSLMYNSLETSVIEIKRIKETNLNLNKSEIDKVKDNGPELSKSQIEETVHETHSNKLQTKIDTVMDNKPGQSKLPFDEISYETDSGNLKSEIDPVLEGDQVWTNFDCEDNSETSKLNNTKPNTRKSATSKTNSNENALKELPQLITPRRSRRKTITYTCSSELYDKRRTNKLQSEIDTVINNGPELCKLPFDEIVYDTDSDNLKSEIYPVTDNGLGEEIINETDSDNVQPDIDKVTYNVPEVSISQVEESVNETYSYNLNSEIDEVIDKETKVSNEDDKKPSIDDITIMEKLANDTERLEINVEQSTTPKKNNTQINNTLETSLDEFNNSIVDTTEMEGDQGRTNLNSEDKTSELNNTKKIKSATSKTNISNDNENKLNEGDTELPQLIAPRRSRRKTITFTYSSELFDEELFDTELPQLIAPRRSRPKTITNTCSSELFDKESTTKLQLNVKKANKRKISASDLKNINKKPFDDNKKQLERSKSVVDNEELNNSNSLDIPVINNCLDTIKPVNESNLSQLFDEPQPSLEEPLKKTKGKRKSTVPKTTDDTAIHPKKLILKPGGKVTKLSIKETSYRKIPKNRLEDALQMLHDEEHPIWEDHNVSCNAGIHRYWEPRNAFSSEQNMKLRYARQFLMRRDWFNLSKVLCLCTIDSRQKLYYYPLLAKYATMCLAHTDKEQFNRFVQFLLAMDDGSNAVMKQCTKITQKIGE